jgi:mRNA interferase RelE/StbE
MKVVVHRRAARYLRRLPTDQREAIKRRLRELADEPDRRADLIEMKGRWKGYHRLRIGSHRLILFLDGQESVIYVDHIGPRGDVYKR